MASKNNTKKQSTLLTNQAIDTSLIVKRFSSLENVIFRVFKGFDNNVILKFYGFSDIQIDCLEKTFTEVFEAIYLPLKFELVQSNGSVGKHISFMMILGYNIKIVNTFSTFGLNTKLNVRIPINMFFSIYMKHLCNYYEVANDVDGRKSIKRYLKHSSHCQMLLFFKSWCNSELLCITQSETTNIYNHLLFSIDKTFLDNDDEPVSLIVDEPVSLIV